MKRIFALMLGLEAAFSRSVTRFAVFFADAATMEELQNLLISLNQQMQNLQAAADAENRNLTEAEESQMSQLFAQFEATESEIDRRNKLDAINARMSQSRGRQTGPTVPENNASTSTGLPSRVSGSGGTASRPSAQVDIAARGDVGKHGFRSFGEFAQAVRNAGIPGGGSRVDPRLIMNAQPTTVSTEGIGPDGGFAVPPDFRQEIVEKVLGEASLISRTDQLQSSSNNITIPKDETTPWQTTGGIQAYWEGENQQIQQSKVALEQTSIRLNALKALVNVTTELLEDAPALSAYIRKKAPQKLDFKITNAIINGTGVGMPLGLLNSPAKVKVSKKASQTAATIVFENIVNMYSRVYSGCRANLVWLINQDIEPQLLSMQFPTSATAVPVYLPPGGLSASPYGLLLGRPVIPTEACQTIGTEGDIIATDLSAYMTAMKVGGAGVRQDVSIHLYFDYDAVAFRFVMRVAGQPWWNNAVTPLNGSNTRSCIVTLESRL